MQTIKQISWDIFPLEAPLYSKKCNKCRAGNHFYCSNRFRVNSQKKNCDVWLIYKCTECDSTFNITIFSRINPHLIDKDMYGKFMNNDPAMALRMAFDQGVINRNRVQVEYESVVYEVKASPEMSLPEMSVAEEDLIEISVSYPINLNLRLSRVLRDRLGVSLNTLSGMVEQGIIRIDGMENIRKDRVKDGMRIWIDRRLL